MNQSTKHQTIKRKSLYRKWHRRIGFSAAIFIINLAVTGILLNHSDDLELHNQFISSKWLLNAYGINSPSQFACTKIEKQQVEICSVGNQLYSNSKFLIETHEQLIGSIELENVIYLATTNKIYLYTLNFELIEILNSNNDLPKQLTKIGITRLKNESERQNNKVTIETTANGILYYQADENIWLPTTEQFIFSEIYLLKSNENFNHLQQAYLHNQVSYLKFIQDLHSLRLLNFSGKILTDLFGLILVLLVVSGFIAWQRRTKRESNRH